MTEEQAGLYAASVARMRSQITGKAYAAAQDNSQKGVEKFLRALGALLGLVCVTRCKLLLHLRPQRTSSGLHTG